MRILHCTGHDARLWSTFVHSLPHSQQDVHFLPEYAALYDTETATAPVFGGGGRACAAYWESPRGGVLYPFLLRPVFVGGEQPSIEGHAARELAGLYGMGGPLLSCPPGEEQALYAAFDRDFQDWCADQRLASEFICPHLLTGSLACIQANASYHTEYTKDIVYVQLRDTNLLYGCNKGRKYEIHRSGRCGVTCVRVTPDITLHEELYEIYCATMHRKHASDRWFVQKSYFQDCIAQLGSERVSFFAAHIDGRLCAWNMLLHHGVTAYYHFAGVTSEGLTNGAPSLLLYTAALWVQAAGYERLYLGGGTTRALDDTVFRFKHSFSQQTLPFFRAWRVLHSSVYDELCRLKMLHELHTGYVPNEATYFPLYRR